MTIAPCDQCGGRRYISGPGDDLDDRYSVRISVCACARDLLTEAQANALAKADFPDIITDADKAHADPVLGANWNPSRRVAERVLAGWEDADLKKIIDKAVDTLGEALWMRAADVIQGDTESNVAMYIRRMVDETVIALLAGERWALERYPLAKYHDGERVRAAISKHIPAELVAAMLDELRDENARLKERIEMWRPR